jgi:lipid-A-disaccharide synthase
MSVPDRPLRLAIVAGEASGDELGASLLRALRARGIAFEAKGVGGPALAGEGLLTLFPQSDIAVMGFGPVIRRLPLILRRIRESVDAIIAGEPDILLTIDAADFSKRVAKRVRARAPGIPTIHWVCPSVWAWRPGRAPAMKPYIDHILCLLPFEPAALDRLRGPRGHYVGHPLIERLARMRPRDGDEAARRADARAPELLLLPGSRMSEVRRLLPVFLAAARVVLGDAPGARFIIPTLDHVEPLVRDIVRRAGEGVPVEVVTGEEAKYAAFRRARAALAASGTVTLELALAQVPMIAAYRVAGWEAAIARRLVRVPSVILPNIILDAKPVPEFLQDRASPEKLGPALSALVTGEAARQRQIRAFQQLERVMRAKSEAPSARAASLLLDVLAKARDTKAR